MANGDERMSDFEAAGSCSSDDVLVTLSVALGPDAIPLLKHLSACDTCLARLGDVERLRWALAGEDPLRPGFVEEVVRVLEGVGAVPAMVPPPVDPRPLRGVAALNPILAAGATLFLILPAGGGSVLPSSALVVSALVGLGVLLWNSLSRRIVPGL